MPKVEIVHATYRSRRGNMLEISGDFPIKSKFPVVTLIIFCVLLVTTTNAYAIFPVWDNAPYSLNDGNAGNGIFSIPVTVRVTDPSANLDDFQLDTIQVTITSRDGPGGTVIGEIDLTLEETGVATGEFVNSNLALMNDDNVFSISDTVTATIFDDTLAPSATVREINDASVTIATDSDSAGIQPVFTETGVGTNLYAATIRFGTTTNPLTNTIKANAGDIVSVVDQGIGGNIANGIIAPNPSGTKGAILAVEDPGEITATYGSDSTPFTVAFYPQPGRGSGGLVAPTLVVDIIAFVSSSSGGGSGCKVDCTPPTLGVDKDYTRFVSGGFTYNNYTTDVEMYYTPFPLIRVNVGDENKAVLKIYDNLGPKYISHIGLAFGLDQGKYFGDSKASIEIDMQDGKISRISSFDPEKTLQNINATTRHDKCSPFIAQPCLVLEIKHTFRAPLDFNMVSTLVWDKDHNQWQNYYNHGIEIQGKSLNPPHEYLGIDRGHVKKLTETGKNTAIDEEGNKWTFDKEWVMDYHPQRETDANLTAHGYDRNHAKFLLYKEIQEEIAKITLERILGNKNIKIESDTVHCNYITQFDVQTSDCHKKEIP